MELFNKLTSENQPKPEEAEVSVDLSGLEKAEALKKLDAIVTYCKRSKSASLCVSFDPARPGGGETLFQPIMRYFKVEKLNGYISHATPLISQDKASIFAVFNL